MNHSYDWLIKRSQRLGQPSCLGVGSTSENVKGTEKNNKNNAALIEWIQLIQNFLVVHSFFVPFYQCISQLLPTFPEKETPGILLFTLEHSFTSQSRPCLCVILFIACFPPASKQQTPTNSHQNAWLHISSYMHFPEENSSSLSYECDRVGEWSAFKVGNIWSLLSLSVSANK